MAIKELITPNYFVRSMGDINPDDFCAAHPEIMAISYDRDGTVTDYHSMDVPPAHLKVIEGFAAKGIIQGFNSNAGNTHDAARVKELARRISQTIGAPFLVATSYEANGAKLGPKPYELFADITDMPMTVTAHIGDQIFKDVLGANRCRLMSILVTRYGDADDWRVRYLQRPTVELAARVALGLPPRTQHFPRQLTTY